MRHTEEGVHEIALRYKNKSEFRINHYGAYAFAKRKGNDFFKKITQHMYKSYSSWNTEKLLELGRKYDSQKKFREENPSAYQLCYIKGLLPVLFENSKVIASPKKHWMQHLLTTMFRAINQ